MATGIKEVRDQALHFGSCCAFTLLTVFPAMSAGVLVVLLWAATREYYQHKVVGYSFLENVKLVAFSGADLMWSYGGMLTGLAVGVAYHYFL